MNDKLHIAETDLTLYALGSLAPAEAIPVEAHLQICARCKEELRQNTIALAAYAQTTPEVELPAGARDRFMAKLASTPQNQPFAAEATAGPRLSADPTSARFTPAQTEAPVSLWHRIFGSGWSPVLVGAFALLLVVVGVDDLQKRAQIGPLLEQAQHGAIDSAQLSQLMELLTSPQAKRVALHPGPVAAPPPEGRVTYAARTGKLLLTASNLHPLPAGKVYELWILQPGGKAPLAAGTFAPDGSGNATMILADAPAGLAVQGFGVTVENTGGSPKPTSPIVLSGL